MVLVREIFLFLLAVPFYLKCMQQLDKVFLVKIVRDEPIFLLKNKLNQNKMWSLGRPEEII